MAATTQIILVDYGQDQKTGHITVRVKSKTTDGNASWEGPEMTYGVDAIGFAKRFNSDPAQFEAWIASQHRQYIGANAALREHLDSRVGKVIG